MGETNLGAGQDVDDQSAAFQPVDFERKGRSPAPSRSILSHKAKHNDGLNPDSFADKKPAKREKTPKATPLGQYLLEIVRLHNAMDIESDARVLREHFIKTPPLHVRRTLYQSDYSSSHLETGTEYRDQIVYRATKQGKTMASKPGLIMVDQLWMYILDDN